MGKISQLLWRYLEQPYTRIKAKNASSSDAIVVLSGSRHPAPGKSKILEWRDPDRFLAGIQLFKEGKAPYLIFTGGYNPFESGVEGEGQYYKREAVDLGIPLSVIKNTSLVTNTLQEAFEVKKLLKNLSKDKYQKTRITLVTSAFHMQRAKILFERQGLLVQPFPVDFKSKAEWSSNSKFDPLAWFPNANNLSSSSRAIREIMGRLFYRTWK